MPHRASRRIHVSRVEAGFELTRRVERVEAEVYSFQRPNFVYFLHELTDNPQTYFIILTNEFK